VNNDESKLFKVTQYAIVPDQVSRIKDQLIEWSDNLKLDLVLTTGGSGLSPRDVTPEATKEIIHREIPSLPHAILVESLKITKFAMLSRSVCGTRGNTLILNLPGSKKGSQECFEIVKPVLKHALDLINDNSTQIKRDHFKIQNQSKSDEEEVTSLVTEQDIIDKPRQSSFPMISMSEALDLILSNTNELQTEQVFYLGKSRRL
jgi:gephyrin